MPVIWQCVFLFLFLQYVNPSEKPTRPLQVISSPYTWVVPTQIKPLWPAWVSWLASIRFLQVVTCSQSSISILKQGQSLNKKVDDYTKKKRNVFTPCIKMSLDPLVVGCFYVQSKWIFQHHESSIFLWITFPFFFKLVRPLNQSCTIRSVRMLMWNFLSWSKWRQ